MAYSINRVSPTALIPGMPYYALSTAMFQANPLSQFRATFVEYWRNDAGYLMARFRSSVRFEQRTVVNDEQSWRIWEHDEEFQAFNFYKAYRFTPKEKAEIKTRLVLRQRRQYERGLTGTLSTGKWIPRDLIREISLRYLTDDRIGRVNQWKIHPRPPLDYVKLGYSQHESMMFQDMEAAITKANVWEWMKTDPGPRGYSACRAPEIAAIERNMKYSGHSGATFAQTMHTMQLLARIGRAEFCGQ